MRLLVLQICGGIAALVFLAMLSATARHRLQASPHMRQSPALAEYLWATIPWVIIVACATPAVLRVLVSTPAHFGASPLAAALRPAPQRITLKPEIVIDQKESEQRQ